MSKPIFSTAESLRSAHDALPTLAELADYHRQGNPPVRPLIPELVEEGRLMPSLVLAVTTRILVPLLENHQTEDVNVNASAMQITPPPHRRRARRHDSARSMPWVSPKRRLSHR